MKLEAVYGTGSNPESWRNWPPTVSSVIWFHKAALTAGVDHRTDYTYLYYFVMIKIFSNAYVPVGFQEPNNAKINVQTISSSW